jgi:DNA-binding transcriptional MerR regulator
MQGPTASSGTEVASPVRMAELSRSSGVPVATIKYYLREGLLPPGTAISATRAEYGEAHLRRLGLIRALVEIGEVPVAAIGKILAAVDDESASPHVMLGTVQYALGPHPAPPAAGDPDWQGASREAGALIAEMGWAVTPDAPARILLVATLAALRRASAAPPGPGLRAYAEAVLPLAAAEVASLAPAETAAPPAPIPAPAGALPAPAGALPAPETPPDPAVPYLSRIALAESAVVGMVLYERILIALHRLAQEDASRRRYGQRHCRGTM